MTHYELARLRSVLTDARILKFLRAADRIKDRPSTVLMVNQGLNNGRSLDEVLCKNPEERIPPRYSFTIALSAISIDDNTFRITFGGATKSFGDGGTWLVEYDPNGEVSCISMEDYWSK